MSLVEDLQQLGFGQRVAEEEGDELAAYFVETDLWRRVQTGDVDVVYGPKGSGKSALYLLALSKRDAFASRGIFVIQAENPRGNVAFSHVVNNPPTSEQEFIALWKLYFLTLVGTQLRELNFNDQASRTLIGNLVDAGLIQASNDLTAILRRALQYVARLFRPQAIEAAASVDSITGMASFSGKIIFNDPTPSQDYQGFKSVDALLDLVQDALTEADNTAWLVIDRLDVAFADSEELESNAIRALFRTYLDFSSRSRLSLKIFLRSDIWSRVTEGGFREASHITRSATISWDENALLNLVVRRALRNDTICARFGVSSESVMASVEAQRRFYYRMFPEQVEVGSRKPKTFDWMLSRTQDGHKQTAPRELIHLLNETLHKQIEALQIGNEEPREERLFSGSAIKAALPEVSKVRLEQTLYAEYSQFRDKISRLDGQKTSQRVSTLATIWEIAEDDAKDDADALVDVGFFEPRGNPADREYWVPFLYRDSLHMIQGSAE